MKNTAIIVALASVFAGVALAADNYLGSIQTIAGVANCYPYSVFGSKLSVQCKVASCHVAAGSLRDGGGTAALGQTADMNSVLVTGAALYDVDMKLAATPYICVTGQDAGAVKADIFIRTGNLP